MYAISIPKFYKKYIEYFMLSTYLNVGAFNIYLKYHKNNY